MDKEADAAAPAGPLKCKITLNTIKSAYMYHNGHGWQLLKTVTGHVFFFDYTGTLW